MKLVAIILLGLLGISCGGVILDKKEELVNLRAPAHSPAPQNTEKLVFLRALESKYLQENKPLNLSITRSMIMEMEGEESAGGTVSGADLKKLRKNQTFLSLELTIEHLSHREQVKLGTRHSAFHKRP